MHFSLVMKLNDGTEREFPLREDRTVIGRETRCHVRIALPTVAERHCEIVLNDGELKLSDLGSDLGTLVNGSPVRKTLLEPADELTVGPVTFHVRRKSVDNAAGSNASNVSEEQVQRDAALDNDAMRPAAQSEIEVNLRNNKPLGVDASSRTRNASSSSRKSR